MVKDVVGKISAEIGILLKLAVPIFISQLCSSLLGLTDSLMSASVGTVDFAAISLGVSLSMPVMLFCMGVTFGLAPITAHIHGSGRAPEVLRLIPTALTVSLAIALAGSLALFFAPPYILTDVEPELAAKTTTYLRFISAALPGLILFFVLKNITEGLSITVPSMVIVMNAVVLNIPLNYICIHGCLGLPAYGSPGCGLATAFVTWTNFALMALYVRHSKLYARAGVNISAFRFVVSDAHVREVLRVGLPIAVANVLETGIFALMVYALTRFGSKVISASQIASNAYMMAFMIPISMAIAVSIRVGRNLGAGSKEKAVFSAVSGFLVSLCLVVPGILIVYFNRLEIIGLFTSDPEVAAIALPLFVFVFCYQSQDPFFGTAFGVLRGFKDTLSIMYGNIVFLWCLAVPAGYLAGLTDFTGAPRGVYGMWFVVVCSYYLMTLYWLARAWWLFKHADRYLGRTGAVPAGTA